MTKHPVMKYEQSSSQLDKNQPYTYSIFCQNVSITHTSIPLGPNLVNGCSQSILVDTRPETLTLQTVDAPVDQITPPKDILIYQV
jgi:hypothetical protein